MSQFSTITIGQPCKGVFITVATPEDILREIQNIIGSSGSFAREVFEDMDSKEKITYLGYQLYRKGYYDGLNFGLEVGIIEDMKRQIRDNLNKPRT